MGYYGEYDVYDVRLADKQGASDILAVYGAKRATGISEIGLGDLLVIKGHLQNFNGNYVMAYDNAHNISPTVVSVNGQGGNETPTPSEPETPTPSEPTNDELKTKFYNAVATTIEADKEYVLALYQASHGKVYYFNGAKSGNFIGTTTNFAETIKIKLESVEGGYRIAFVVNGVTQYIDVYEYTTGKVGVRFTDTPSAVFTYDADFKTLVTNVLSTDYYLGTYRIDDDRDYRDIRTNKITYIIGDNTSNIDRTQFPVRLLELTEDLNG